MDQECYADAGPPDTERPEEAGNTGGAAAEGPPYAECVLCRKPTEYPESRRGIVYCPVCEWQEAGRTACSG